MVFQDDKEHLGLLELRETVLVYLRMGFLVDQAILEHLGKMEKMEIQDHQEGQARKE